MKKRKKRKKPKKPRFWTGSGPRLQKPREADTGVIISPEEKAAKTRGLPLAGKIHLDQYEVLIAAGYDGDVIMRWTAYHAHQEIEKRGLTAKPYSAIEAGSKPQVHVTAPPTAPAVRVEQVRPEPQATSRPVWACPICGTHCGATLKLSHHLWAEHSFGSRDAQEWVRRIDQAYRRQVATLNGTGPRVSH